LQEKVDFFLNFFPTFFFPPFFLRLQSPMLLQPGMPMGVPMNMNMNMGMAMMPAVAIAPCPAAFRISAKANKLDSKVL